MLRIETRPLSADEERQLVEEVAAGPSRGEAGCMAAFGLLAAPAVGFLIGDNVGHWLGVEPRSARLAGIATGLLAGAAWTALPFVLARILGGDSLRDERRQRLAAGPVERWTFEPARGWSVEASHLRALLLELTGGRLVLLATRHLESLPASTFPERVEMEVLPQLERVLSLSTEGRPRATETFRPSLYELGSDYPLKNRRFCELAPEGLDGPTRERLGLSAPTGELPPAPVSDLPLNAVVESSTEDEWLRRLRTPGARRVGTALMWMMPALGAVAVLLAPRVGLRAPTDGAIASLVLPFVVSCVLGAALGDLLKRLSIVGVLGRGQGALVRKSGLVRARRTFPAPLTGRAAVVGRANLLLGPWGLLQAVDFDLQVEGGATLAVDVRNAWLLRGSPRQSVVRVETRVAKGLLRGAGDSEWFRKRRYQVSTEDVVQDGDAVHLLGRIDENGKLGGTPELPMLVWTSEAQAGRRRVLL